MWFMHGGGPPHFTTIAREHLHLMTGRTQQNNHMAPALPSHSSAGFIFCEWGYTKCLAYASTGNDVADLQQFAADGCWVIQNTPRTFTGVADIYAKCEVLC